MCNMQGRMTSAVTAKSFLLAGNATFTVRSVTTQKRYTFKVRRPEPHAPFFVMVMHGSDNERDFTYLGTIFPRNEEYRHGKKSRIAETSPEAQAFAWVWRQLQRGGSIPDVLEFWHEGKCGRCGRTLTVPSSIATGFGPECATLVGATLEKVAA